MKIDLIQITLNDEDLPVLKFSVSDAEKSLEQKILGSLLRRIQKTGIELHLVRSYPDAEEKPHYDYEIRAIQPNETD